MDKTERQDWIKAGNIAANALHFGAKFIKPRALLLDVADKIEEKIKELGGRPAFPANISVNSMAAHDIPLHDDERAFNENDIVKLDVGAHINGCIGDTALTVDISKRYTDLVKASREAVNNALKVIRHGAVFNDIGKAIQETITGYNYSPIINLSGHSIDKYIVHSGLTVPNYANSDSNLVQGPRIFAIEPFATTGTGKVTEGGPSNIYRLSNKRNVRDAIARTVLAFIDENYKTLPFAGRWVIRQFPGAGYALNLLEKQNILYQYPKLPEKSKGPVSQAEHTVLVEEKKVTITTQPD